MMGLRADCSWMCEGDGVYLKVAPTRLKRKSDLTLPGPLEQGSCLDKAPARTFVLVRREGSADLASATSSGSLSGDPVRVKAQDGRQVGE